jgi:3'-5' exonuclease
MAAPRKSSRAPKTEEPKDTLVFDVETVGLDWESFGPEIQRYLLGRAKDEVDREALPHRLGLAPGTGRIIAIGAWNPDTNKGGVLLEGPSTGWQPWELADVYAFSGTEAEMLAGFWELCAPYRRLVTFNGRAFDGPYVMTRSALLGVKPSRNLVPQRYNLQSHCDLQEVLTYFGADRHQYSLDFWCHRFGIESPKKDGLSGAGVQAAYKAGRIEEIARYCLKDAIATARLYQALQPTLLTLAG